MKSVTIEGIVAISALIGAATKRAEASTITTLGVNGVNYEVAFLTGTFGAVYGVEAPDGLETVLPGSDLEAAAFGSALVGSADYAASTSIPSIFAIAKETIGTQVKLVPWVKLHDGTSLPIPSQNQTLATFETTWAVFYGPKQNDVGSFGSGITPTGGDSGSGTAVVPLPASGLLLLAGLAGLALTRRGTDA